MFALDTELADGRPVTVEFEFEEGDPHTGLADDFEITVYFDGKDITDDLSDTDTQAIRAEVAADFDQYVQDCQREAAIERAETALADRKWNAGYGH